MGSGALSLKATVQSDLTFKDFITNGVWNVTIMRCYMPQELHHQILQHPVLEGDGRDEVFWRLTASGNFIVASAFQEVRQARNYSVVHARVWHPRIPLKMSFFMMRLLMRKLPVTGTLWRVGVHLASKCLCCYEGANETLKHVFSEGQVATEVWNYFGRICGVTYRGSSLRAWLMV